MTVHTLSVNADFAQRAVVYSEQLPWVPSPMAGVERRMLDRVGGEIARATSIVRYAPGSEFAPHIHDGGEEFLVLEGVFSDEHGDYGPGAYGRNPPGSHHQPFSRDGGVIFVKLWQMRPDDQQSVRIDSRSAQWQSSPIAGRTVLPLFEHGSETVRLARWEPGTRIDLHTHPDGEEILVVEGKLRDEHGDYPKGSWVRYEPGSAHAPYTDEGCLLYVKSGHLEADLEITMARLRDAQSVSA